MSKPKLLARYWIAKNKCIAVMSNCLAIVTYDENGEIVKNGHFWRAGQISPAKEI